MNTDGLERRYHVERIRQQPTDELGPRPARREPVEDFCFVLRPERDPHARVALAAYADSCEADYPVLAADLRSLLGGDTE